jgi:hypothetical protein
VPPAGLTTKAPEMGLFPGLPTIIAALAKLQLDAMNLMHGLRTNHTMVSSLSYRVKALPEGSGWHWEVKVDGSVSASGAAATATLARVSAIRAAHEVNKHEPGPDKRS